jgi:hypothetical protein
MMLTKDEAVKVIQCLNIAIQNSPDAMATAVELFPIRQKLEQVATEEPKKPEEKVDASVQS